MEEDKGFFGIGIYYPKRDFNIGTLWRTAYNLGASFIFTIGKKYKKQSSDVFHTYTQIPMYHYEDMKDFTKHIPRTCQIVGLEIVDGAVDIMEFKHPKRAVYLLGAEDLGLQSGIIDKCQHIVKIPSERSLNVAVSGAVILYDRKLKQYINNGQ